MSWDALTLCRVTSGPCMEEILGMVSHPDFPFGPITNLDDMFGTQIGPIEQVASR